MGVLVLMYHRTPPSADHILDISLQLFRAQIQALQDAGVRFIRFGEALDERWFGRETFVAITFDDGHSSNLNAMAFLHDKCIPSTTFYVSEFLLQAGDGFMDVQAFKTASMLSEVGAHGATHVGLASLAPAALEAELSVSKAYLEELCGQPVTTMSAPGGSISREVVRMALKLGFKVIGDSVPMLNTAPGLPVHRVCMMNGQSPEQLLALVYANQMYWLYQRIRRKAGTMAQHPLGGGRFAALKRLLQG